MRPVNESLIFTQETQFEEVALRTVCTCYFGRLCRTTHKTWEEFHADKDLIDYCCQNFGYACPYCNGTHTGRDAEDCGRRVEECKKKGGIWGHRNP